MCKWPFGRFKVIQFEVKSSQIQVFPKKVWAVFWYERISLQEFVVWCGGRRKKAETKQKE